MKGICLVCGEHVAGLWELSTLSDFFWGRYEQVFIHPKEGTDDKPPAPKWSQQ